MWLCVTCVVNNLRPLCNATDAAVSGTQEFSSCFSHLIGLVWTYILFYISWDLCGYKNIQMLCRSACFKRWIFRASGCLFLCAFHVLLPFAFDMSNSRGKTCCKSLPVPWVSKLWEADFCSQPASLTFSQSGFLCWQRDVWWAADYHKRLSYSTIPCLRPFSSPVCLYSCEVLCYPDDCLSQNPSASLHCQILPLLPYLHLSPLQSASQSRCSSPAHLQQGAGSHLQQHLIDLINAVSDKHHTSGALIHHLITMRRCHSTRVA